jgi:hypothetical protein
MTVLVKVADVRNSNFTITKVEILEKFENSSWNIRDDNSKDENINSTATPLWAEAELDFRKYTRTIDQMGCLP